MIFPEIIIKKESYFIVGFGQEHCPVHRLATDRQFNSVRPYGLCNTQDLVRAQADAVCFEYPFEFFPIGGHPNGLELLKLSTALVNDHNAGGPGSVLLFPKKHALK